MSEKASRYVERGTTYIYISKETRQRIRDLMKKEETYDEILGKVLDRYKKKKT